MHKTYVSEENPFKE